MPTDIPSVLSSLTDALDALGLTVFMGAAIVIFLAVRLLKRFTGR